VQCRMEDCEINFDYVKSPIKADLGNDFEMYNQETVISRLNIGLCLKWQNC
jgi:hypothetical protein